MPVKKDNQQISIVLSKEIVELLDKYTENEVLRSRSAAAARIIIIYLKDYFKQIGE